MKYMKEYIITYSSTVQTTEDTWKVTHPVIWVNSDTTIGELSHLIEKANGGEIIIRKLEDLTS